eukprot:XP_011662236.1 PREDICTED: uncharacterized protein LOC105436468 [Strongylocentrotus purpuratus]
MNAGSSKREYSTMVDQEDFVNAEAELAQLLSRYRIAKNDRRAYLEESSKILRKQRRFIDTLEKEKEEFRKDMLVVENLTNQRREQSDRQTIAELTETCDENDIQIIEETHKVQMLDKKLRDIKATNTNQLRIQGGWYMDQNRRRTTRKRIRLLEGRLDKIEGLSLFANLVYSFKAYINHDHHRLAY